MSDRRPIAQDTRDKQRIASDPALSAWVSAHAGSGKTHVLSQRVVRLLLAGAPPSHILCLTYTKAAAANMATRIFDILAGWALLDDEALTAAIVATGAPRPSSPDLAFARRLFARTVETPGGLKIQTIHAFCERILHLFPFEANVAASFRVLDDLERAELLERARRHALACAVLEEGALNAALMTVSRLCSSGNFDELIRELLDHRETHRNLSTQDYPALLRRRLGLTDGATLASIEREIIDGGLPPGDWPALAQTLRRGGKKDGELGDALDAAARSGDVEDYLQVFFTQKGEPRGSKTQKIISAALQKQQPALLARLEDERDRLVALVETRKAAAAFERSLALGMIGDAILSDYERMKSNRGLFDFDDLIERTRRLLTRSSASWVLYKLDSQIDHILVDEAQDTSAAQWDILAALADEFCAGEGARGRSRSFFAVGDEKQSIFSFQGAAPEKFDAMRHMFAGRFREARKGFETVRLTRSFRSSPDVLGAVDTVFAHEGNRRGLAADPQEPAPRHEAWKADVPGLVEIWEPEKSEGAETPPDWRLPLDYVNDSTPAARLARKIARKTKALLAGSGECVEDKGVIRAVRPGDVLILVRKRDAFFEAVIRALKAEGVAVAGADRLDLTGHIAVMDLVALGRVALLREDDLTLAVLLKSPLVGLDDDDLIALAPKRSGALFDALAASPLARNAEAAAFVEHWAQAARRLAPFDFYSLALGAGGGREKLVARLGVEANDAIDEFLRLACAFEREQAPTLTGFLASVEALKLSIKRDMEQAGDAVRVMTVHAAKGLEAKIVFLPDTCGAPAGRHDPKLFVLGEDDDATLVWSTGMQADPPAVAQAREALREAARDEHRRLLYVALTRAEERLYIAGFHGVKGRAADCWHDAIRDALEPSCAHAPDPLDETKEILVFGKGARMRPAASMPSAVETIIVPAYARTPAPRETPQPPPLRPATALAAADVIPGLDEAAAPTLRDSERLLVGRLTHSLLQRLPDTPPERRLDAARKFLALRGGMLEAAQRERLARAALAVIEDASLAALFGPRSAPEVEIVARLAAPCGEISVTGRIDRLAEAEDEVIVADFKTGAPRHPPTRAQLRQLAIYRAATTRLYPGKRIRCVLIFTETASVEEPQAAELDIALEEILREARA